MIYYLVLHFFGKNFHSAQCKTKYINVINSAGSNFALEGNLNPLNMTSLLHEKIRKSELSMIFCYIFLSKTAPFYHFQ